MSTFARRLRSAAVSALVPLALVVTTTTARAQDGESPTRDAAKHFQRGVALYGEADYRAALVEFKRAYTLAPNAAVLYNIGETEYQLQDYAGALTTFRRYLAEAGPSESHRAEVESNVEVLRSRVGHVAITTVPTGADVTIDDQPIGKTPLDEAALVSIGRRKVTASLPGRTAVSRYVDVAADDNVALTLQLPAPAPGEANAPAAAAPAQSANADVAPAAHWSGAPLRTMGWVATGLFAAGATTFGVLAVKASSDLRSARDVFPTTSATLSHDASLTTTYAILADSLAAAAIVVGGVTLVATVTAPSSGPQGSGQAAGVRVVLAPSSARLEMTF